MFLPHCQHVEILSLSSASIYFFISHPFIPVFFFIGFSQHIFHGCLSFLSPFLFFLPSVCHSVAPLSPLTPHPPTHPFSLSPKHFDDLIRCILPLFLSASLTHLFPFQPPFKMPFFSLVIAVFHNALSYSSPSLCFLVWLHFLFDPPLTSIICPEVSPKHDFLFPRHTSLHSYRPISSNSLLSLLIPFPPTLIIIHHHLLIFSVRTSLSPFAHSLPLSPPFPFSSVRHHSLFWRFPILVSQLSSAISRFLSLCHFAISFFSSFPPALPWPFPLLSVFFFFCCYCCYHLSCILWTWSTLIPRLKFKMQLFYSFVF